MAFIVGAIIGGAAALGGGLIAAHGATSAANAQVSAANSAANLQHEDASAALAENRRQFDASQQNIAPWLNVGRSGLANLAYQLGILPHGATIPGTGTPGTPDQFRPGQWQMDDGSTIGHNQLRYSTQGDGPEGTFVPGETIPGTPGTPDVSLSSLVNPNIGAEGSLAQDWTEKFNAPDNITEQNDPGYQARLQAGQDAIQRSAAARGGLLTGGTAKDLNDWTQNQASNEYGNVYNRAFNDYTTRYNTFKQNQADRYNRLSALSGTGQVAASQIGQLGAQESGNNTNILLTSGQQIGQDLNNAGAARASGYVGAANAYSGAVGGIGSNLTSLYFLSHMPGFNAAPSGIPSTSGLPLNGSNFNFSGLTPTVTGP